MYKYSLFLLLLAFACNASATLRPKAITTIGTLTGAQLDEAQAFFSVPYAEPPLGELRFRDPVAKGYHGDIDVSTNTGVGCVGLPLGCSMGQCPKYHSEDCLYLDVFVPNSVDLYDSSTKPPPINDVIVWFHGGSFYFGAGTAPEFDGRYLAQATGAIIVSGNYRLLPFGFLAMEDDDAPKGNMGFHDQQMVLEWVGKNIQGFGGNPHSVTIFGESAGAQAVGLHMMSAGSAPLYARGIMDSNPVTVFIKTLEVAQETGAIFAQRAGCEDASWECVRDLSTDEVVEAFLDVMAGDLLVRRDLDAFIEPFAPVIDGVDFSQQEIDAFRDGNWNSDKSFIIGTNSEELYEITRAIPFPMTYGMLQAFNNFMWTDVADNVTALYAPKGPLGGDYRDTLGDELTHFVFTCSNRAIAREALVTKETSAKVYVYRNYHPFGDPSCDYLLGEGNFICGTCYHGADLSFIWRTGPLINQTYTEDEKTYINAWSTYIGNFAASGNPNYGMPYDNQQQLGDFVRWPPYVASENQETQWETVALDAPYPYLERSPVDSYCDFWDGVGYHYPLFANLPKALDMLYDMVEERSD